MDNVQYFKTMLQKRPDFPLKETSQKAKEFIAFEGAIKKHPSDPSILVLLINPFEPHQHFFEFTIDSVCDIEEIESITNKEGKTACRVRLWVKKGSLAFKTEPFIVK